MRCLLTAAGLATLAAASAQAGAIERTTQSSAILFEEGNYAQIGVGRVYPHVDGSIDASITGIPFDTDGNVLKSFTQLGAALKMALTPDIDVALVFDQPIGADLAYPGDALYPIAGTTATLDSDALTLMARARLPSDVSLIAGVRAMRTSGDVKLPVTTPFGVIPYELTTSTETDFGYLVGVAYERKDIGLRISLTYNSAITHDLDARELTALGTFSTTFTTRVPQSVNLEAQTGVAEDTLVFGSIRWVDWSAFDIDPTAYQTLNPANPTGSKLVGYEDDYITYSVGLGRKFTENWSGVATVSYEDRTAGLASNLGPTDGYAAIGLGFAYTTGPVEISAVIRYLKFLDTQTDEIDALFAANHAVAVGAQVGYRF